MRCSAELGALAASIQMLLHGRTIPAYSGSREPNLWFPARPSSTQPVLWGFLRCGWDLALDRSFRLSLPAPFCAGDSHHSHVIKGSHWVLALAFTAHKGWTNDSYCPPGPGGEGLSLGLLSLP